MEHPNLQNEIIKYLLDQVIQKDAEIKELKKKLAEPSIVIPPGSPIGTVTVPYINTITACNHVWSDALSMWPGRCKLCAATE